ncbi:PQQ-binding-like beta-propeller repeat protein [Isoptericola sp. NPDC056578]|uniref:outer membrane protein assembly factor BamB family protein n=1 Tax=Isoptericola sp. NPDC056578 TaxID=3345870 RepID=UPI00367888E2
MPPRFRRPEPMTTFELVPDDEREDAPDDAPDDRPHESRRRPADLIVRARARWRTLSRRGRVAVAGGTAVVVVAAATAAVAPGLLDARAERQRAEAIRGMPGVVGDLSEPVDVVWSLPEESSVAAVLPGGVLAVTDGAGVRAMDAATGDVVWEHPLDDGAMCGPAPWTPVDWSAPVDTVVCVEDASRVTVLDADGTVVSERELDLLEPVDAPGEGDPGVYSWSQVVPAADGTVAVLDETASVTEVPWPEGEDAASLLRALRDTGWHDPTLRVVDAVTGEERAEVTVPLTEDALESCGVTEGPGEQTVSVTPQPWIDATPSATTLGVCGLTRAVTPTGGSFDVGGDAHTLVPLPGGRFLVQGETSEVRDAHGERLETIHGSAVAPLVDTTPDGARLVLVGAGGSASSLAALGADGAPTWSVSVAPLTTPLARVGDAIVLADETSLTVVDARTGAQRWRVPDLLDGDPEDGETVAGAVTDGTRLLLAISPASWSDDGADAPHRLVALDLRDGSTAWERTGTGVLWGLFSAGGTPVTLGNSLSGLGGA